LKLFTVYRQNAALQDWKGKRVLIVGWPTPIRHSQKREVRHE